MNLLPTGKPPMIRMTKQLRLAGLVSRERHCSKEKHSCLAGTSRYLSFCFCSSCAPGGRTLKSVQDILRKRSVKIIRNAHLAAKKTELACGLFGWDRH